MLEQLEHEYGLLVALADCPFVPEAEELVRVDHRLFLVMSDLGDLRLATLLDDGALPVDRALTLGIGIADALGDIHQRRIVHKDLNPSNILVQPDDTVKLVDFGIATRLPLEHVDAMPPSMLQGTITHLSPEQTGRMSVGVDHRSDLYSLGVTLHQLFTGALPFSASDPIGWCHCHLAQAPPSMHARRPDLPRVLDDIVAKLLAKRPDARYQSAEGLAHDLRRCRDALASSKTVEPFVLGERDRAIRFQIPQRIYGRDDELATVLGTYDRVAEDGALRVLQIEGRAGIGKSTIVHELHAPVVARRGGFLRGKFDQHRRDAPYDALLQACRGYLRHLVRVTDDETFARRRQQLRDAVGSSGRMLTEVMPELTAIIGPQPPLPSMGLTETRNRFQAVFRSLLRALARPGCPLVIVLDDMQWADSATLQFLPMLTGPDGVRNVCLVLAYRDDEVDATHPLRLTLEGLDDVERHTLPIGPLDESNLVELVADAMRAEHHDDDIIGLTRQLIDKTAGNPFFVLQFLQQLHRDGLLTQDDAGRWLCDPEEVRQQAYADNVVELMVQRLEQLEPDSRDVVSLAACIGGRFDLRDLSVACERTPQQVLAALWPATEEYLVVPVGRGRAGADERDGDQPAASHRFQHDRIQQAAYLLLPEEQRLEAHARIGRRWLEHTPDEEQDERLFSILGQLNRCVSTIDDRAERQRLAQLNHRAGLRAKNAGAVALAKDYFTHGRAWLDSAVEASEELRFSLDLMYAECCCSTGDFEPVGALMNDLEGRATTKEQRKVWARSAMTAHVAQGDMAGAMQTGLRVLAGLGITFPEMTFPEAIGQVYDEVAEALGDRPISSLADRPTPEDPEIEAAMSTLGRLWLPCVLSRSPLMFQVLPRLVVLSMKHGLNADAVAGVSGFSMLLTSPHIGRFDEARQFGDIARDWATESGDAELMMKVSIDVSQVVNYYVGNIRDAIPILYESLRMGQEIGNYTYTVYVCNHLMTALMISGEQLARTYAESLRFRAFVQRLGNNDISRVILAQQRFVECMRGNSARQGSLDGDDFDEAQFEEDIATSQMGVLRLWYLIHKLGARYWYGDWRGALPVMKAAGEFLDGDPGTPDLTLYFLYSGLLSARCLIESDGDERDAHREQLDRCLRQYGEWARSSPVNMGGQFALMRAEDAWARGDLQAALSAYDESIRLLREHGFTHYLGLACERLSDLCRAHGLTTMAHSHASEAATHYRTWGAMGKVRQLSERYSITPIQHITESTGHAMDTEDVTSIVKASRALSREVHLDELVRRLLEIVRENAGAQHGLLLLRHDDDTDWIHDGETSRPASQSDQIPWSVVEGVRRSARPFVVVDAQADEDLRQDPAIAAHGIRSLTCVPLRWKGQVGGVLVLDHRELADVFTPARVALLQNLASQAAISVDNARLYADLEQRVEDRTRQLQQAQRELVDMAYASGMAQVATNVLHNLGNALNGVTLQGVLLRDGISALPVHMLEPVGQQLQQRLSQPDSDAFVSKLVPYLDRLHEKLDSERTTLLDDAELLCRMVNEVGQILSNQRTQARAAPHVRETSTLQALLDDAVQLCGVEQRGVGLERDYGEERSYPYPRHLMLQILANLVTNACQAIEANADDDDKRLTLKIRQADGATTMSISDTGIGFDPALATKLFQQGFSMRKDGTGIGLHSAAIQAKSLDAQLSAHSEGRGRGATFTMVVPHPHEDPLPETPNRRDS